MDSHVLKEAKNKYLSIIIIIYLKVLLTKALTLQN